MTLEKSEKIRTDLENDLMKMSERIAGLKSDNVTLNSNLSNLNNYFLLEILSKIYKIKFLENSCIFLIKT